MRLFLIFVLSLASPAALAQRELTAIVVNYASPEQLVAVIKPYLSQGSSVSLYQNQLILNVTPQELSKTRELLQRLDMAGHQLLISVRIDNTGSNSRRNIEIKGSVRSGDTGTETRTTVRAKNFRGSESSDGSQTVRATEGMPAYIATGMSAPVQSHTVAPDGQRHYQQDYATALAGFYATTWLDNDTVRISIDQSNNQLEDQRIATQQLRSEVSGALGEWLPIGVINSSANQRDSGIGARGQSSQTYSSQLFIKVETLE